MYIYVYLCIYIYIYVYIPKEINFFKNCLLGIMHF